MQFSNNNIEKSGQAKETFRLPLFLRVIFFVFLFVALLLGVEGGFFWKQHKNVLVAERMRSAEQILAFLASSVKVPLLTDDTLRLSSIVGDAADLEGIVYCGVLGRNNEVLAHSGQGNFEGSRTFLKSGDVLTNEDGMVIVQYTHPIVGQAYDLSRVVLYREKPLGTVHLGLSSTFINAGLDKTWSFLLQQSRVLGFSIILLLLVIVFLYTQRLKQKTSSLIRAIDEYSNGNLQYRIEKIGNDESGDVARALHHMSQKLVSQEPSQEKLEQYMKFSSLDRILESPISQVESYAFRRQVAVLFASIKGFGSYAGTEQPENIVQSLNQYISIVTRVISKHGGYVDKVVGDSVVGIFGVSLYRESHTARAIQAAIDLQRALSEGSQNESRLLSNVCIGISSGIVLSGNIGSYSKIEYSSIGESIKEAYWLSHLGHPGEIILGEEIHNLMKDDIKVESLPPQNVLGGGDALKCYRLLSLTEKINEHEE